MSLHTRNWLKGQDKRRSTKRPRHQFDTSDNAIMPNYFPFKRLVVPSAPSRKINERISGRPDAELDDFLSSDGDLENSFASTMSIQSPIRDASSLASENDHPDYAPMDISPAPSRIQSSKSAFLDAKPAVGRPRAYTSSARLFGRDMSNSSVRSNSGLSLAPSASSGTTSGNKKLQRAALPLEWLTASSNAQPSGNLFGQDAPPSPASDAMDIDSSFVHIPSSSLPEDSAPLTARPGPRITIEDVDVPRGPVSAAPRLGTLDNLFFNTMSPERLQRERARYEESVSGFTADESPIRPWPKKRRSDSPSSEDQRGLPAFEDSFSSSPPPMSSPSVHKLERISSGPVQHSFKKPILPGLGAPISLNPNNKRPRRPVQSAMVPPGDSSVSPHPGYPSDTSNDENGLSRYPTHHELPPARRAFSAMLPHNLLEQSMSSEDGSFDIEGPDMSSPAQAYAKRQQVKTIRRCDGTDDFRPTAGATALVQRDRDVVRRGLRRSEVRMDRVVERDTPRSKYLNGGGLGGFGDNESHGKILPCHRVKEDGLMRINSKTMNDLLDGVYNSQIQNYHVIDCRFDYEYNGGHIPGAMNLRDQSEVENFFLGTRVDKPEPSTSGDMTMKTIIVFHCEFSIQRAPTFAKHLRAKDRSHNSQVYPKIHYPEVYVLEGGYNQYFRDASERCEPSGYVPMNDPDHADSRRGDMDQFRRKAKFSRTRSYAYGEGKGGLTSELQPKRNTASGVGSSTLFAAGNAARSRRNGILGTLQEDYSSTQQSDDEETDIGDSPCPPPNKGAGLKSKRMGRALSRAETIGSSRTFLGI